MCNNCGKNLSSYKSLWRHKKSCMSIPRSLPISEHGNGKRGKVDDDDIFNTIDSHHRNSIPVVSEKNGRFVVEKDGKMQSLRDAFTNQDIPKYNELDKKIFQSKSIFPAKKMDYSKIIGSSSDEESPTSPIIRSTPKKEHPAMKKTMAKKFGPRKLDYSKMIGPSSDEESQKWSREERKPSKKRRRYSSDSDEGRPLSPPAAGTLDDINEDELPLPPKVQFLPENKDELCARAIELLREFGRGKYKNRNELVCILDELKRRDEIESDAYTKLNDYLSSKQALGTEEEDSSEEEETVEDKISSTVRYLVEHDMKEIQQLLELFENTAGTYYEEELEKLRTLVETWIEDEIEGKEPELDDIKILLTQLKRSKIPRKMLIRFETILNDIRENQYRVTNAIRPMVLIFEDSKNREDLLHHINHMIRQKVINEEQEKNY